MAPRATKTADTERRARADQAEHIQEMLEGHCLELLQHVYRTKAGTFQLRSGPEAQAAIKLQLRRMLGHKSIDAPHLKLTPFPYHVKQLYPYDPSKW